MPTQYHNIDQSNPTSQAHTEIYELLPEYATAAALGIPRPSLYELIDKSAHLRTAGDLSAEEITRCFHECGGDLDAMVRRLEVSRRALGRRLKELGLEKKPSPAQ